MGVDLWHLEREQAGALARIEADRLRAEKKRLREALAFALKPLRHSTPCQERQSSSTDADCICGLEAARRVLIETA